jgi:hypothetical protein
VAGNRKKQCAACESGGELIYCASFVSRCALDGIWGGAAAPALPTNEKRGLAGGKTAF